MEKSKELFIKLEQEVSEATKELSNQHQFKKHVIRTQLLCELILEEMTENNTSRSEMTGLKPMNVAEQQPASLNKQVTSNLPKVTDSIFDF